MKVLEIYKNIYETASKEARELGLSNIPEDILSADLSKEESVLMLDMIIIQLEKEIERLEQDSSILSHMMSRDFNRYLNSAKKLQQKIRG